MKFQDYFKNETATISPELKAAYNNYRLAFFRRAVRELDPKDDRDLLTAKGDKKQNETIHRPF